MHELKTTATARLAHFSGNNPLSASEHGGMIAHPQHFSGSDFLVQPSQLRKNMAAFSAQIQQAVSTHEDN